jgi:hypothetical protein
MDVDGTRSTASFKGTWKGNTPDQD